MSSKIKAPAPAKQETKPRAADGVLALFQKNLATMRVWYRGAATPGHEAGLNVVHELVLANVMTALALAIEGKEWKAPTHNP